jgi:hypothetical protein
MKTGGGQAFKRKGESLMKKHLFLAFVLFTLISGRVAAQGASVTFAKEIDFDKYKTYKWVTIENGQHLDELTRDQLIGTLEVQLAKRGLTRSPSDKADLLIGYQIARPGDKRFSQSSIGASYGSATGAASASGTVAVTTVHSGQLVLDMYDAERKQLVWRGLVADAIDANAKPDKKQKHLDKAVEKLLKDYPPQKK